MSTNNKIQKLIWKRFPKTGVLFLLSGIIFFSGLNLAKSQSKTYSENNLSLAQVISEQAKSEKNFMSINFTNATLEKAFEILADRINVGFSYNPDVMPNKIVSFNMSNVQTYEIIYKLLEGTNLEPVLPPSKDVIILREKDVGILPEMYQETITGTVTDVETGEALPGVNVSVMGSQETTGSIVGTTTNGDGEFELSVPTLEETLVFSFIGYERLEVDIAGRTELNIQLMPDVLMFDDIVVVGYSSLRKKDISGSVSVVNPEEFTKMPDSQVGNLLQGMVSGVNVISSGQPGESPSIRIRGINTFGNNEPLYVVDGVPTQDINQLNPNSVESMQVLKDASAASIYGSRASNGVIVITTKKGLRSGLQVTYDSHFGVQVPPSGNPFDILNPQEMAELKWRAIRNVGGTPGSDIYGRGDSPVLPDFLIDGNNVGASEDQVNLADYNVNPEYTDPSALEGMHRIIRANKEGTNWFQEIFDPALTTNHNLAISGGSERSVFSLSFNYRNQDGILNQTHLDRYNIRVNSEFNINDNIRVGENLSYTIEDNRLMQAADTEDSPIAFSYVMQPIIPVYDVGGNFAGGFNMPFFGANPVRLLDETKDNDNELKRLFGNVFAEIDLTQNLVLRTSFGGEVASRFSNEFQFPTVNNSENTTTNGLREDSESVENYTWTNQLTYDQLFGESHDVQIVTGVEANKNKFSMRGGSAIGFFTFDPSFRFLSTGAGGKQNYSDEIVSSLFSLFGKVDYSFDGKYLLSATVRRDGSSKFLNNRYGIFPAVSAGWRLSQEKFMQNISWLDDFKIRTSYGVMGNQINVNTSNSFSIFGANTHFTYYDITGSNTAIEQGFSKQRIGNPDARWEKTKNFNIGIDASLYEDQFEMTIDYYRKNIIDLLFNPELPGASGTREQPFRNVGNIRNTGLDASLTGRLNISNDTRISTTFSFTTYVNEIKRISENVEHFSEDSRRFTGSNIVRNEVGYPISSYYGYKIVGFWNDQSEVDRANSTAQQATGNSNATYQTEAKVGRFRYEDTNGDGRITPADRVHLGDPHPDFSAGLNINLNYKNFDMTMFFYGVKGNEIWNQVKWWTDFFGNFNGAKSHTAFYDSWTPDNKDATGPIQETTNSFSTGRVPNSYFVEDGSYLRMKNLMVGYTLTEGVINTIGVNSLRIYLQATNLFTITNYSGLDPEISGNTTSFGIDEGIFPNHKSFTVGINLQL